MTDIEKIIIDKLDDLSQGQIKMVDTFIAHSEDDATQFQTITENLAGFKGRVYGGLLVLSSLLSIILFILYKVWK
jgi:hypothetical protein